MKRNVIFCFGLCLLVLGQGAHATNSTCPNLNGTWKLQVKKGCETNPPQRIVIDQSGCKTVRIDGAEIDLSKGPKFEKSDQSIHVNYYYENHSWMEDKPGFEEVRFGTTVSKEGRSSGTGISRSEIILENESSLLVNVDHPFYPRSSCLYRKVNS